MQTVLNYLLIGVALVVAGMVLLRLQFDRERRYLGGVAGSYGLSPTFEAVFGLTHPIFGRRVPRVEGELNGRHVVIENWTRSHGTGSTRSTHAGFTVSFGVACEPTLRISAGHGERPMSSKMTQAALAIGRATGHASDAESDPRISDPVLQQASSGDGWATSNAAAVAETLLATVSGRALRTLASEHHGELVLDQARLAYTENLQFGWSAGVQKHLQTLIPLLEQFAAELEQARPAP